MATPKQLAFLQSK